MTSMFSGAASLAQEVTLDTSQVGDMEAMFRDAASFNQPVLFNTSRVATMREMFFGAGSFNQKPAFDTSQVIDMAAMFREASSFDQVLSFDTGSVRDMDRMLEGATSFQQDVFFDTARVETMQAMFNRTLVFDKSLANFNVARVQACGDFCTRCQPPAFVLCSFNASSTPSSIPSSAAASECKPPASPVVCHGVLACECSPDAGLRASFLGACLVLFLASMQKYAAHRRLSKHGTCSPGNGSTCTPLQCVGGGRNRVWVQLVLSEDGEAHRLRPLPNSPSL